MSFYDDRILPHIIHLACGMKPVLDQRQKIVPHAWGRILEIGMGRSEEHTSELQSR